MVISGRVVALSPLFPEICTKVTSFDIASFAQPTHLLIEVTNQIVEAQTTNSQTTSRINSWLYHSPKKRSRGRLSSSRISRFTDSFNVAICIYPRDLTTKGHCAWRTKRRL